ncbi:acyl-CoA thioesterase [Corynebacterium vitaeruminis]|uniref:acyl-CoA thioesterase n=1 Tax=Corynebacterium vitaeruminis TaxID=38305 RepID=UPI00046D38B6|nr:acyl-CoA thioesterase [Corynebacterium vitaeruminis]
MVAEENRNVHITKVPCRWSDFDRFGHITNPAYIELAQEARQIMAHEEFVERGVEAAPVFVRKIEVDYLRPIMPDTFAVIVETQVVEVGRTSFTTRQEIKDLNGTTCAIVEAVQVVIDLKTARPRAINDAELKILTRVADSAK